MRALKVTADLAGPLAGDIPKIDALIERAMAHRCDPRALGTPDEDDEYPPDGVPIPIARRRVQGCPWSIPLASWPIFSAAGDCHDYFNQRFAADPALLTPSARTIYANNSGEFRSYRLPLRVRDANKIVWFCVGEAKEIRRLLIHPRSGVRYLGKKTSIGYGMVNKWTVEPTEHDCAWFSQTRSGTVLMRGLPASMELPNDLIGYRKWFGGVAAPYWNSKYHIEMVEPC